MDTDNVRELCYSQLLGLKGFEICWPLLMKGHKAAKDPLKSSHDHRLMDKIWMRYLEAHKNNDDDHQDGTTTIHRISWNQFSESAHATDL